MRHARIWLLPDAAGALPFSRPRMAAGEEPKEKSAKKLAHRFVYPGAKGFGENLDGVAVRPQTLGGV